MALSGGSRSPSLRSPVVDRRDEGLASLQRGGEGGGPLLDLLDLLDLGCVGEMGAPP